MRKTRKLLAALGASLAVALAAPATAHATQYYGPNGPREVTGWIEVEWLRTNKAVGNPLTSEAPTPFKFGAYNFFERGAIYWSPNTGAHETKGSFYDFWAGQGWENGALGFPLSNEAPATRGVYQLYEGGTMYWSPASGAHSVRGEMLQRYGDQDWERGPLGFPTAEMGIAAEGGTFQRFAGGALYDQGRYYDPEPVSGAFYGYWAARGYERGYFGWPLTEEYSYGSGNDRVVTQYFENGTLYWNPLTGVTEEYPDLW